jgi:hypothetical protein
MTYAVFLRVTAHHQYVGLWHNTVLHCLLFLGTHLVSFPDLPAGAYPDRMDDQLNTNSC